MENKEVAEKLRITSIKMIVYRILPILASGSLIVFVAKNHGIADEIKVYIILGVVVMMIFAVLKVEQIIEKLKDKQMRQYDILLSDMIDYPHYESERGFKDIEVGTFGIIKLGNIFYSNNYFQCIYKGVSARQADVIIHKEDIEYNLGEVTKYFEGRIFEFRSDKINVQNVKVFSKGYESWLNVNDDRVDVDNLLFNDNFDVFSPEPSEASKLLTNELIEHLLILQNRNRSIGFRFGEGKVIVAINGTRPFNMEPTDKVLCDRELAILQEEVQIIIDLIEGLGLVGVDSV